MKRVSYYERLVNYQGDATSLRAYLKRYLLHLKIQGRTQQALHNQSRQMNAFLEWCDTRGLRQPREITKPILEAYQRFLFYYRKHNGEPLSVRSRASMVTPIKAYFRWLAKENYLPHNPASEIDLPKVPHSLPSPVMTPDEVERTLGLPDVHTAEGLRDRAVLELLYDTGIRRMEVANLDLDHIEYDPGTLYVRQGKNQRDRILPMGERATHWLQRYTFEVRPQFALHVSEAALFLNPLGRRFNLSWFSTMAKRYLKKAGVNKPGGTHLFRHTMATLMLENGGDIRFIQAMLGHVNLRTTEVYTRVSIKALRDVHRNVHPAQRHRTEFLAALAEEAQHDND